MRYRKWNMRVEMDKENNARGGWEFVVFFPIYSCCMNEKCL